MAKRKRSKKAVPPHPLLQRLALVMIRVLPGAILIDAVRYKLDAGGATIGEAFYNFWRYDYRGLLEAAIAQPPEIFGVPFGGYSWFLQHVMLGSETWERFLSGGILVFEGIAGICLVLGCCTRLMGFLAALLMACFGLAKATFFLTVKQNNWTLTALCLAAAFLAAGRVWGMDSRLQFRLPRWIS